MDPLLEEGRTVETIAYQSLRSALRQHSESSITGINAISRLIDYTADNWRAGTELKNWATKNRNKLTGL
jgi:hypothetical protein